MRVAVLTNFIAPYRVPFFEALAARVGALRIFVSTPMEKNRAWAPAWGNLDVVVQRTLTIPRKWKTAQFSEPLEMHIPLDTRAQLRAFKPDFVITGEFGARSLLAAQYARRAGVPYAIWATLSDRLERDRGRLRHAVRRRLLSQAACVFVNGEDGARYISRFDVADERIIRANQTTDIAPFLALRADRPPGRQLRVLFVGSLTERKAPDVLLNALNRVASPSKPVHATIVGDGPIGQYLDMRFRPAPGLTVERVGNVAYPDLPKYYDKADVFAFPTLGDEWGLVVNEALAAGVPVLGSSYSQAVEELIRDGENGWVFEPTGVDALERALRRVIATSPFDLRTMRYAARESVMRLTPEAMADVFANAIGVGR